MDLYTEIILDHYQYPHHKGRLADANISVHEVNSSCGDSIEMDIKIGEDGKIVEVGFVGDGCAISQAATSMLTDELIGMTIDQAKELSQERMFELLGVPISIGRVKCALLGLSAAKKAAILLESKV